MRSAPSFRANATTQPVYIGTSGGGAGESERIAYGQTASPGLIPFAVFLQVNTGNNEYFTCGGSLITPRVVLTAGKLHKLNFYLTTKHVCCFGGVCLILLPLIVVRPSYAAAHCLYTDKGQPQAKSISVFTGNVDVRQAQRIAGMVSGAEAGAWVHRMA